MFFLRVAAGLRGLKSRAIETLQPSTQTKQSLCLHTNGIMDFGELVLFLDTMALMQIICGALCIKSSVSTPAEGLEKETEDSETEQWEEKS